MNIIKPFPPCQGQNERRFSFTPKGPLFPAPGSGGMVIGGNLKKIGLYVNLTYERDGFHSSGSEE